MTLQELKSQISTLDGGNWTPEESAEIDSINSAIESGSESSVRTLIGSLHHCVMLIDICERF